MMRNHLHGQVSPYLLQHEENPVDWYPWGEEAFAKAKQENKPVFLSIGYSTCHWCHVMAEESFEDEEIAKLLNREFVAVKVDREERPDIDSVYMAFCQAFTGSGGWPATLFLTPGREPFFAGTYFPPRARRGMPGLYGLLETVAEKWRTSQEALVKTAADVVREMRAEENEARDLRGEKRSDGGRQAEKGWGRDPRGEKTGDGGRQAEKGQGRDPRGDKMQAEEERRWLGDALREKAVRQFKQSFDPEWGGFGREPKFPCPHNLLFLLAWAQWEGDSQAAWMVKKTLLGMSKGGLFDAIGFGFSRYSTDRYYLAPHFEKMLYDNALLILAYAAAGAAWEDAALLDTAEKTAEYLLRELNAEDGGFYSAEDADSEGEEGSFYTFSYQEVLEVLGEEEGKRWNSFYGITEEGNFEGRNIPNLLHHGREEHYPEDSARRKLYEYRRGRRKLHCDHKRLSGWNALAVAAFAVLSRATGKECYLKAAVETECFIRERLVADGRLAVSLAEGKLTGEGQLADYAYYVAALLELHGVVQEERYLEEAERLCRVVEELFLDREKGGFFLYGAEQEQLILRPKETYDGALPSGNSAMAWNLVRLHFFTGKEEYRLAAERQLAFLAGEAADYPAGHGMYLLALEQYENPPEQITVVLAPGAEAVQVRKKLPLTAFIRLLPDPCEGYGRIEGKTTYYVCGGAFGGGFACLPPQTEYVRRKS